MSYKGATRYPFKVGPYSSHAKLLKVIGDGGGRRILDVGCAEGDVALALSSRGWEVLAIEPSPEDAATARSRGIDVVESSVEEALPGLSGKFDAILAADVLEHLLDPEAVLNALGDLLAPGGRIVVSLPNVAHLSVRLGLLAGAFNYQDSGILDRTHLRFFTSKTVGELFESAGMRITGLTVTPVPLERLFPGWGTDPRGFAIHRLNDSVTRLWPQGLGYQFVLSAERR